MKTKPSLPKLVPIAFIAVVLIWSTTPLGIVWSSESVHPTMAVLLRMVLALVIGCLVIACSSIRLPLSATAFKLYGFSAIGIVGGMLLSYMAARYIPSGTMSLLFGLSPIISGLLAQRILGEAKFSRVKIVALILAFSGLAIVCSSKLALGSEAGIGLVLILCAVTLFSLSGVLIKTVSLSIHPIASTVGALLISTPLFALAWLLFDGTVPTETWSEKSIWSIVYLGIFGSLIGFVGYFYILQHLNASTVSLVTLITPVFAMALGAVLNQEQVSQTLIIGAGLVLLGLAFYLFGDKWWQSKRQNSCIQ
ncbi:DMT family transporter [Shewanella sp. Scap07]|uniref:DMT family transporter n=1 Tax=Shewanella sp. Scap07 TaxID=2589987 RepID=UPI0015B8F979|nr:DMT family transporter [Shewanella sp. Scap07]QLE86747.1 DMT family transporter [Shewanella sp. Scap07]